MSPFPMLTFYDPAVVAVVPNDLTLREVEATIPRVYLALRGGAVVALLQYNVTAGYQCLPVGGEAFTPTELLALATQCLGLSAGGAAPPLPRRTTPVRLNHPIVAVPGGYCRLDCITHTSAVEGEPDYLEVFFIGGHRAAYHREEIAPLVAWFAAQAERYGRAQFPRPSADHRLDTLVHAEEGTAYGD